MKFKQIRLTGYFIQVIILVYSLVHLGYDSVALIQFSTKIFHLSLSRFCIYAITMLQYCKNTLQNLTCTFRI